MFGSVTGWREPRLVEVSRVAYFRHRYGRFLALAAMRKPTSYLDNCLARDSVSKPSISHQRFGSWIDSSILNNVVAIGRSVILRLCSVHCLQLMNLFRKRKHPRGKREDWHSYPHCLELNTRSIQHSPLILESRCLPTTLSTRSLAFTQPPCRKRLEPIYRSRLSTTLGVWRCSFAHRSKQAINPPQLSVPPQAQSAGL